MPGALEKRNQYSHLKYKYPETYKWLVNKLEDDGPPVTFRETLDRAQSGRLYGNLKKPSTAPGGMSSSRSLPTLVERRESVIARQKQEADEQHVLRLSLKERRNPFGGWYEGSSSSYKVVMHPDTWIMGTS
mmetsp:Transcript_1190/g.2613  ORF Transcript_1190/g.2613 Transcript_1190/m.2613 type:complete len:131 (-) Transcript_1190:47-439(-)